MAMAMDMEMNTSNSNSNSNNNPDHEHNHDHYDDYYHYYPSTELEYLSTKAFNHAVDLYHLSLNKLQSESRSRSEEENVDTATARRWGRKAIELAGLIIRDDEGNKKLVDELRGRFDELFLQQA